MLTENDIVIRLSEYLELNGYQVLKALSTSERGVDHTATSDGITLYVEAKGETSSDPKSARFGLPFDSSQVRPHI